MPVPLFAAGAIAAVVGATHDCEYEDYCEDDKAATRPHLESNNDDDDKQQSAAQDQQRRRNSSNVRFEQDPQGDFSASTDRSASPVRSIEQQYFNQGSMLDGSSHSNRHHTSSVSSSRRASLGGRGSVYLRQPSKKNSDNNSSVMTMVPSAGFVNGDFCSGKVRDIMLDERCFVMRYDNGYNPSSSSSFHHQSYYSTGIGAGTSRLLAVGLTTGLAFYETNTYSLVHTSPRSAMVSALCWISPSSFSLGRENSYFSSSNRHPLLLVGGLDGTVTLYRITPDILEISGPTVVQEFNVAGQVRALDAGFFGKLDPPLVVAVGDKSGAVTVASLAQPHYSELTQTETVRTFPTAVLSLSLDTTKSLLAVSTKGGQVELHRLHRHYTGSIRMEALVWSTLRNGPVRCVTIVHQPQQPQDGTAAYSSGCSHLLAFGGYDKRVVLVDTQQMAISREIEMQGTINTIEFDARGRYFAVGSRDKSLTLFDTSTFVAVKTIHTNSWVTSISWGASAASSPNLLLNDSSSYGGGDVIAVRSDLTSVSVLDLTPIGPVHDIYLSSSLSSSLHDNQQSSSSVCTSWSRDGALLARIVGSTIVISDASDGFRDVAASAPLVQSGVSVIRVAFCHVRGREDILAAIDEGGYLSVFRFRVYRPKSSLHMINRVQVAPGLKALAWSTDGTVIACGGKDRLLYLLSTGRLESPMTTIIKPIELGGRIWDICFDPTTVATESFHMAVALGDYTTVLLNAKYEPTLQVPRSRTCRCVTFHPHKPLVATGDGADMVAIVDLLEEELVHEIDAGGRVNTVSFSPAGDFLVVGSDDNHFRLYDEAFNCVQEVPSNGFALTASFSPNGRFLALGSANNESYSLIRLGPFLGIDLIPLRLKHGIESLPEWALMEALYRSGTGPSFLQRHTLEGSAENLRRVATILRQHPTSIHSFNRSTGEGFFDTILALKRPSLLKLAATLLVDGTLDADRQNSVLTTTLPRRGKEILMEILEHYPPEFVVEIMGNMSFVKVPFTEPRYVDEDNDTLEKGSASYTDPWPCTQIGRSLVRSDKFKKEIDLRAGVSRTPAVLPLPGLGEMDFLAMLLSNAPADVFEPGPMALVLRVLWNDHIRIFFYLDFLVFLVYYACWVSLVEMVASAPASRQKFGANSAESILGLATLILNTIFTVKEVFQSRVGRRGVYWRSLWNFFDLFGVSCVYLYISDMFLLAFPGDGHVPLSVVTSLLLTVKLLSYLRGFSDTGWLISVLITIFHDVSSFLIILSAILMGFAISFRALLASTDDDSFGSLWRSYLSTFELTITGSYEPSLFLEAAYSQLSVVLFVLAVTCVLVVCLNALISILADSFARVQEHAVANRRKEQASLIVEYFMLLPPWKRRKIERDTQWFHTLLEVDADGDLLVETNAWVGGLNALRRDVEKLSEQNTESTQRAVQSLRDDVGGEIQKLKRELASLLEDVAEDVKHLKKRQAETGGISFSGKNVTRAVKAIRSVGQRVQVFGKKDKDS